VATGDGMAAAYRAGAELRDMEFMQFHPTVLYVAGSARYLISDGAAGSAPPRPGYRLIFSKARPYSGFVTRLYERTAQR